MNWEIVSALAQVAASVATFLAVWVALRLAREERAIHLRVRAQSMAIVNEQGSTDVVMVSVDNVGLRRAVITSLYWSTGYRRILVRLPFFLQLRGAFQNEDWDFYANERMPWSLEPGEAKSTFFRNDDFFDEFSKHRKGDLFRRMPFSKRYRLLNHRVGVGVKTIDRVVTGRVAPELTRELEAAYELNRTTGGPSEN